MKKGIGRRIGIVSLALAIIFANITAINNVIATAEEGKFTAEECPYNIAFTKVEMGYEHSLAIDEEGNLWAWGDNDYGQLGDGTTTDSYTPIQIKQGTYFKEISAGENHSLAIDEEGNLWAWGYNNKGQLGDGTTTDSYTPIQIKQGTKFTQISAGTMYNLAIDTDSNLWAWGINNSGVLGDGTTTPSYTPIQIKQGTKFKEIATTIGYYLHSLAIDEEGNLWAWGNNKFAKLGDGTTTSSSTPIQIKQGTKFAKIEAANGHSLAIDEEGNLWAWGDNSYGQLGDGTTTTSSTPIQIKQGTKFSEIELGCYSSFAIDEEGNLWAWGDNDYGQLGDGTTTSSSTPIQIKQGTYFKEISAHWSTLAIDENGNLWATGWNTCGEFGDGTTEDSLEYIQITNKVSSYTVTFMNGTETVKTETVTEGGAATAPSLTKAGYTLSWDTDFSNITSDLTVKAIWTANTNTAYKIEHYKQNTSSNGYTLAETENKTGTTDAVAVALAKTYEGFTENTSYSGRVATGTIAGDGSLVLKLYYDRNSYSITLNTNEGTINSGNVTSYTYGVGATLPTNVTKTGYTFNGWYANSEFIGEAVTDITTADIGNKEYFAKWTINQYTVTFKDEETTEKTETVNYGSSATAPSLTKAGYTLSWDKDFSSITSNLTVNAVWTANPNTAYKVEHYKQNTSLNGYELADTENKTGTTDTTATAVAKTYEGFTENTEYSGRVATGSIAGDGSLVLKLYYDRNSYSVTLNTNEGTINSGNVTSYTYGVGATLSTDITKTGYTFDGWYENSEFTGEAVTDITTADIGNKEYFAKWTINQYTVTFKDGENTVDTQTVNYGSSATAPELEKAGYTLSWDIDFVEITEDLTVNAVWTANIDTAYKVEHYKQNTTLDGYEIVTEDTENLTGTTDTEATATAKTYEGFTENTEYSERVATGTIAGDGNLILKLYYDRNIYNVTLDPNGGTINSGNVISYVYGIGATLPTDVTKTGYSFIHWWNSEENVVYNIPTTSTGDKKYMAVWLMNQYTVTFKDGENIEKTEIVNHGSSATAPELTKAGYTLSWNTDFSNVTSNITVNAVWIANTNTEYKVEHYKQNLTLDGYELVETEELTGTTDESVTAVAKEYEGFIENTEYEESVATGNLAGDGSLVLKLYYDRKTYNVNINIPGQEGTTYIYGQVVILPTDIEKEGYTFGGWYDNEEFAGEAITQIVINEETANKSYYIKWIPNEYTVTLNTNEGTINSGNVTSYTYGVGATLPTDITKTGYTFDGWYENSEFTGEAVTDITTADIGNKEYFAKWTINQYTVTFKDGENTVDTQTVNYGSSATAPELTKVGYTLSWDKDFSNITSDITVNAVWTANTNTAYKVEHYKQNLTLDGYELVETEELTGTTDESVTAVAKTYEGFTENTEYSERVATGSIAGDGSLVLKLYYDRKTYNVNINIPGQEGTTYIYGQVVTLPTDIEKEGYTFGGWYDNEEFAGEAITQIVINEETANKSYYIKWIPNEYKVTLNTDGGTIDSGNVTSYTYGVGATLPTDVTKVDYIFVGWYDNADLTGETVTNITTTDIGDKTYYAKWVEEEKFYITSEQYSINLEESYITKVSSETNVKTFIDGITTNATLRVLNADREEVTEDDIVSTGYIIELDFKGTKYEYEIAVRGDLDGNGKVTITDLSILNQVIVKELSLTGIKEKATDIDHNQRTTVTDLSMMNQYIVGTIEL